MRILSQRRRVFPYRKAGCRREGDTVETTGGAKNRKIDQKDF